MDVQDVILLPNSKKQFRSIELKNGLCALLVSDPELEWNGSPAAVSMAVRAGNFLDPPEAQGLAHFLEHMLFLGSDKFPMENALDNYLNMHGGDSTAATDDDHTIFFLFAESKLLKHVLDMFARPFIAPLMKPDSMNREIKSIDSEFEILKQSDTHRLYQLRRHTSKNDHAYNRFTAGNKKSLRSKNMNALLTRRTKTFFADHYHGGSMKLCVIGGDSLTDLERWVRKYFDGVKDGPKSMHAINPPKPIWDASKLHVIESVECLTALQLVWMLPPYSENNHLEMPEVYLIEVLSNQSKESLYGFFKEKDWVADIEVSLEGHLGDYRSGGRLCSFSLYLTSSYWKMKEIESDCIDVSGMAANSPSDFARYLSVNMLKYPIAHVVSADYVRKSWNPKAIVDLMEEFTPKNMRIDLIVNSLSAADPRTEPWIGTG
ncbi:hypothetical protein F2Q70_00034969 [Brassica cretica]|uniref:Peptidase M16 N-terminal domain-containing protein n=1 Tax=Brassica cretica TaxID=69181 RepID=A0A8S9JSU0_BRACR|nr:hypothetical protein F2Q70_00034969 [Brassica cretica]